MQQGQAAPPMKTLGSAPGGTAQRGLGSSASGGAQTDSRDSAGEAGVVELLSSDDEEWEVCSSGQVPAQAPPRPAGQQHAEAEDPGAGGGERCPVCGQAWAPGSMTNAEVNQHVDECLMLVALAASGD